jgi:hypothetical protein
MLNIEERKQYRATCQCGWHSRWQTEKSSAEWLADWHEKRKHNA